MFDFHFGYWYPGALLAVLFFLYLILSGGEGTSVNFQYKI
jgi:hypothetical protein